jgi:hypothetical protein
MVSIAHEVFAGDLIKLNRWQRETFRISSCHIHPAAGRVDLQGSELCVEGKPTVCAANDLFDRNCPYSTITLARDGGLASDSLVREQGVWTMAPSGQPVIPSRSVICLFEFVIVPVHRRCLPRSRIGSRLQVLIVNSEHFRQQARTPRVPHACECVGKFPVVADSRGFQILSVKRAECGWCGVIVARSECAY